MSPYSVLVPKKSHSWTMYVDSGIVNNIIVKYKYPISRLDDMLDELYGLKFFFRIDVEVDIIILE